MKYLKLMVLAIVAIFTFGTAQAQVLVKVGGGPYFYHGHHWHHRAPYYRNHHRYYRYW
jgi:hypothetical protein